MFLVRLVWQRQPRPSRNVIFFVEHRRSNAKNSGDTEWAGFAGGPECGQAYTPSLRSRTPARIVADARDKAEAIDVIGDQSRRRGLHPSSTVSSTATASELARRALKYA
ncbi:hypothetical protein MRX96_021436 [Rhipicephalus microplus]